MESGARVAIAAYSAKPGARRMVWYPDSPVTSVHVTRTVVDPSGVAMTSPGGSVRVTSSVYPAVHVVPPPVVNAQTRWWYRVAGESPVSV